MPTVKIFVEKLRRETMHRFFRKHKRTIATVICIILALALLAGPIVGFIG